MARCHLVASMHNPLCSVYHYFDNIPVYYIMFYDDSFSRDFISHNIPLLLLWKATDRALFLVIVKSSKQIFIRATFLCCTMIVLRELFIW